MRRRCLLYYCMFVHVGIGTFVEWKIFLQTIIISQNARKKMNYLSSALIALKVAYSSQWISPDVTYFEKLQTPRLSFNIFFSPISFLCINKISILCNTQKRWYYIVSIIFFFLHTYFIPIHNIFAHSRRLPGMPPTRLRVQTTFPHTYRVSPAVDYHSRFVLFSIRFFLLLLLFFSVSRQRPKPRACLMIGRLSSVSGGRERKLCAARNNTIIRVL